MSKATRLNWTLWLKYVVKLAFSRGASSLRHISAFFRRLLSLFKLLASRSTSDSEDHRTRFVDDSRTFASCGPIQGRTPPSPGLENDVEYSRGRIMTSTAAPQTQYPPAAAAIPPSPHGITTTQVPTPEIPNNHSGVREQFLQTFSPKEMNRYERPARIECRASDHEWKRCTHPEGALYFRLQRDGKRTLTDANMDDGPTRTHAETFATKLWSDVDTERYPEVELVIDMLYDKDSVTCKYYFVSHEKLVVFWIHEYIPDSIFHGLTGVEANDHIRLAIETQYWFHCELFPNHIPITKDIIEKLRLILAHAISDALLSDRALVELSVARLQQHLDVLTNVADARCFDQQDGYIMSIVGKCRLMRTFTHLKFINFHGQVGARLNADQSLYDTVGRKKDRSLSYVVRLLDLILFRAPSVHIEQLHSIWVDQTINLLRWQSFIGTLCNEWNGFTIYSTVLLAVDVSFLAIPEMNGSTVIQTVTQLAVYFSTTSAVGSLIASVLLTNQSRGRVLESADQAVLHSLVLACDPTDFHIHKLQLSYMKRMANTSIGLNALGIMYSLPFGLIMWGQLAAQRATATTRQAIGCALPSLIANS
ncbi:hypothetical protein BU15DRAFT_68868 [Melanogaster broomeanus]|nr:hypothetical protein BU15DRAFT_68868 [Melanogaster broomeanus]